MTAATVEQLESELAEIFRNAPIGLTSTTHLAIPRKPALLNAMTHGLSGQNLILTAEELPRYAKMGLEYMRECQPVGVRETGNAQLIFEGRWRLHRILSIEGDLLVVSQPREGDPIARIRRPGAARQVNAFREEARNMELISRYETRIIRNSMRLNAELKDFQSARATETPDLIFNEQTNQAIDWYKKLLARSEAMVKAKQEYDEYEAAHRAEADAPVPVAEANGAAGSPVTRSLPTTSPHNSFRKIHSLAAVETAPTFASDPFWSTENFAA